MKPSNSIYSLPLNGHTPILARFISRPNRFLVICEGEKCGRVKAFLPNPGRLLELLLPDAPLYLIHNAGKSTSRATEYTVLAVEQDGKPLLLHTHWCNAMAQQLLDAGAIPGLEKTRVVRPEVKVGHSRFDFLLEDKKGKWYVEIKSCTLFGNHVAMFPDAVTARGRRHLLELAEIARKGEIRCAVVFIVQTDTMNCFMPDYHTDPEFADAMLTVRDQLPIIPLPISWDNTLKFCVAGPPLSIPWAHVAKENKDRGAYLLLLHLEEKEFLEIGHLGTRTFMPGW
ncbi:MAG: DNA/RNA nuclease SfsA, partial [Candidatus Hydrogenedentes bacterium]|nr:DNA/RNA nuclease SfsA [Candidatus Hydrogenedentota bacterium]